MYLWWCNSGMATSFHWFALILSFAGPDVFAVMVSPRAAPPAASPSQSVCSFPVLNQASGGPVVAEVHSGDFVSPTGPNFGTNYIDGLIAEHWRIQRGQQRRDVLMTSLHSATVRFEIEALSRVLEAGYRVIYDGDRLYQEHVRRESE